MSGSPVWIAIPASGLVLFLAAARFATSRQQKEAAKRLARYNDLRIAGRLVEALNWPEWDVRRAAETALVQILPRLKASDAALLNANQRAILYRWLRKSTWHSGQLSILKALEQIGDAAAIPHVQWLANRRARTPRQHEIQAAARDCLVALRSRAEQTGHALLRPAGSPDGTAETLLRPAGDAGPSDPDRLLRPTDTDRPESPAESPEAPEEKEG